MKMNRQSLSALGLTTSLLLSGCTVDAQLASQLLSSLQTAAKSSKTVTGSASVSASLSSGIATADDNVIEVSPDQQVMTRALQVACGGLGMKIASVDESETEDTESSDESSSETSSNSESSATESSTEGTASDSNSTESTETTSSETTSSETTETTTSSETTETTTTEQALSDADTVQPVVIAPPDPTAAPGQPASRARQIKLNANLQFELRQMGRMKGSERNRRFSEIQQHYPEMRNTAPVPVRVRGQATRQAPSVQIIFVQMPGMSYGGQMEPHHGEMNFRPMPAQSRVQMPAGRQGIGFQPAKGPAFGQAGNIGVSGRALLEGLGNLPCQAPQNDDDTDTTSDTSSN
ncbi:hypothetical protein COW36_04785 [bacterium (Candidatus Blackallbacteria) CG17_big_fil_post_rev_8_21_14_2_50_48_46]|uniref:Uncharacterized protein n=1 Tax=bacterium (Candidatus Blackallbacteria) CG17_big_fil_post_rev_8_21_14_2_50_48_46 TaxID=2014261 RepID=A0A2M7G996_9BACT|nr:MAG: hypothetical protein COW64_04160 [bacterium (Candidatus Blackallbacteria) CG18_big_fil_WC_8_21_14_2_50_49_26]PIW18611.1 MAG: hypothetical protein COW36_04785 [bacterium (Candidatus Blackallbacteria) CG17_big_fil_post_rev_8_21_14_2_50_48_46]PIW46403.1 MAG: hypothetical protein COW20_15895 [bacterium (Candidatus Blackallbacteria) CG13_big_fil_rev_8_21_14_2_50_49_14]